MSCTLFVFNFSSIVFSVSGVTDFVAYPMMNVSNPNFLASSAVQPTQKSKAKPTT
jgi:hypothetical protein